MAFNTIGYFIKEGILSIRRNWVMFLASLASIVASLLVLGILMIILQNIRAMMNEIESQVEVTAYMVDGLSYETLTDLEDEFKAWEGVSQVTFVSKEEALEEMKEDMGQNKALLEGYTGENNPLPCSFIIRAEKPIYVKGIVDKLKAMKEVEEINYSQEVVDVLMKISSTVRMLGLGLLAVLSAVSFVIISNTIRLAVMMKRREIHIMKYIGATDWFIRWPFIVEGFFIGICGALLASGLVLGIYYLILQRAETMMGLFTLLSLDGVYPSLLLFFLGLGGGIGILSSGFSVRKHLRV
ncbi:MAG: permease-like cell division protein FtsX [Clostridia bacterium]|jgi:cell division transport system permease protein